VFSGKPFSKYAKPRVFQQMARMLVLGAKYAATMFFLIGAIEMVGPWKHRFCPNRPSAGEGTLRKRFPGVDPFIIMFLLRRRRCTLGSALGAKGGLLETIRFR
jgi:hypothetical protein